MSKLQVAKVTLSTKKVVYLRMMKISDSEVAAQQVAAKANGDANVLQILMQKALVQLLLVQIDNKKLSGSDKEDMDSLFTVGEYTQVLKVVQKISGGDDDMGKLPEIHMVSESQSTA